MGCEYFKDNGEIEYFIPMGGLLFKEVVETEGLISKIVVNIWKAKNKYEMMSVDLSDPRDLKQNKYRIIGNSVEIMPSEPSLVNEPQPVVPVSKPIPLINSDKLVDLDITKVYGIRGYDIFYRDNRLIFEARENYFFKLVKKNDEILWKPKNSTDLPNRVLYKRVNNSDKIKVYFPDKIKEEPPKPKPKLSIDPSTIQVEVSKCKKPGSELFKETVVEVSDTPVTTTLEDPEDLYVAPKQAPKKQWDIDDD
ncbi:phosphoinositide 5-phosphatase [Theileria orientalis]|uniref:Phosphoinositide 5-phosphatase n=1 Tax=Theileria orientalis TaxID=68886 RepID=A0A976SJN4_THEOR|nr:phosphoinositide 5-phosphatase [Theileria orientalis]